MVRNHKQTKNTRKPKLLRLPAVKDLTGLSRSTIYDLMAAGQFPQSVRLSERCVAWNSLDVEAWIDTKINQSTGEAA